MFLVNDDNTGMQKNSGTSAVSKRMHNSMGKLTDGSGDTLTLHQLGSRQRSLSDSHRYPSSNGNCNRSKKVIIYMKKFGMMSASTIFCVDCLKKSL